MQRTTLWTMTLAWMMTLALSGAIPAFAQDLTDTQAWMEANRKELNRIVVDPVAMEQRIHEATLQFLETDATINRHNFEQVQEEVGRVQANLLEIDRDPALLEDARINRRMRRHLNALPGLRQQAQHLQVALDDNAQLLARTTREGPRRPSALDHVVVATHTPLGLGIAGEISASRDTPVTVAEVRSALWGRD